MADAITDREEVWRTIQDRMPELAEQMLRLRAKYGRVFDSVTVEVDE